MSRREAHQRVTVPKPLVSPGLGAAQRNRNNLGDNGGLRSSPPFCRPARAGRTDASSEHFMPSHSDSRRLSGLSSSFVSFRRHPLALACAGLALVG
ncbi:TonB-dependent receptor, partial [Stenotrophomonas maltophilia]